ASSTSLGPGRSPGAVTCARRFPPIISMDIVILCGLIVLSALFSAAEIGFFSVNEPRLRALAEAGSKRAGMAMRLRTNPQRLLLTLEFGDNLVNIWSATLTTIITLRLFGSDALAIKPGC